MGGMVLETNMNEIVAQVEVQNRMEKSEVSLLATLKDHARRLGSIQAPVGGFYNVPEI